MGQIGRASALMWLAVANVITHIIGLLFAAACMRSGTPLAPLPERIQYLANAPFGWTLGWAWWIDRKSVV